MIPVPPPGSALRLWEEVDANTVVMMATLLIKASGAAVAVEKLSLGEDLSLEELVCLGRLNAHCHVQCYEPMVSLYARPQLDPRVSELVPQILEYFHK